MDITITKEYTLAKAKADVKNEVQDYILECLREKYGTAELMRTGSDKSARKISGGFCRIRGSFLFHKRMHFPAFTRPARPARWSALKRDSRSVTSFSIPVFRSIFLVRENPESITTDTSGTVSDVSAIAEERITLIFESFDGESAFLCSKSETELWRTKISA